MGSTPIAATTMIYTNEQIFCYGSKIATVTMRNRIIQGKLKPYECEGCNIDSWKNNPISLQLDHISGDRKDNRLENLRWMCPNCHSQTPTFCSKNVKKKRYSDEQIIESCKKNKNVRGVVLDLGCNVKLYGRIKKIAGDNGIVFEQPYGTGRIIKPKKVASEYTNKKKSPEWNKKIGYSNRRTTWPTKEELTLLVEQFSIENLGKKFGVSGNAVRKWCGFYEIQTKPVGYWTPKK